MYIHICNRENPKRRPPQAASLQPMYQTTRSALSHSSPSSPRFCALNSNAYAPAFSILGAHDHSGIVNNMLTQINPLSNENDAPTRMPSENSPPKDEIRAAEGGGGAGSSKGGKGGGGKGKTLFNVTLIRDSHIASSLVAGEGGGCDVHSSVTLREQWQPLSEGGGGCNVDMDWEGGGVSGSTGLIFEQMPDDGTFVVTQVLFVYVCKYMYTCMPSRNCLFCYNSAEKRPFGNACSWML